jgi:hypothetical protein
LAAGCAFALDCRLPSAEPLLSLTCAVCLARETSARALRSGSVGGEHQAAPGQLGHPALAPDHDLDAVVEVGRADQRREHALLLHHLDHLLEQLDVAELRLVEQVAHPVMEDERVLLGIADGHEGDDLGEQVALECDVLPHRCGQPRHAGGIEAHDDRVEPRRNGAEHGLVGRSGEVERLLADQVPLEDEHEQRLGVVQLDEVEVLDPDTQRAGRGDQAHRVGGVRQRGRGDLEDVLDATREHREERVHLAAHGRRDVLLIHEEVDVVAVAEVGRDSARGGVRLDEIADLAECRQLIADGCRRPGGQVDSKRRRPHRHARAGVIRDDGLEDLLLALIERDWMLHVWPDVTVRAPAAGALALVEVEC